VIEGHESAITDVVFVSKEPDNDGSVLIAATSKDETARVWRVRLLQEQRGLTDGKVFTNGIKQAELKATFAGHNATVESIAVEPRRSRVRSKYRSLLNVQIATGGWDNSIKLWNVKDLSKDTGAEPAKKRKTAEEKTAAAVR
jgi:WD40 repeat protein